MGNLLTSVKLDRVQAATAAGTSAINCDVVDTAGYEGVVFFTTFGTITASAVTSIKVQQGQVSNLSDAADLAGTGITVADDDDGQTFAVEVYRPRERYLRAVISRGTANAVVGEVYALLYGPAVQPVTNTVTDDVTVEIHISPAEGTA